MSTNGDDGASEAPTTPSAEQLPPSSSSPPAPEPAPLREDMLQNAVAFLTHPKVKDSPEATKRSFLDRKGLTTAEVDEAFRRVPPPLQQPATTSSPPAAPVSSGPLGLVTYQQQPQSPQQQGVLVAQPPPGYQLVPSGGALVPAQPQTQTPPAQEPVRWSQVVLGIGVLATGLYAVKSLVFPYIHDAYRSWSERTKAQREAQEQQQRALSELIVTLQACKDEMASNSERLEELMRTVQAQQAGQTLANQRAESSSAQVSRELAGLKSALHQLTLSPSPTPLPSNGHPSHTQRLYPLTESRSAAWPTTAPPSIDDAGFATYANSKRTNPTHLDSPHHPPIPSFNAPAPFPGIGGYDGILPPPAGYRGGYQDLQVPSRLPAHDSTSAIMAQRLQQGAVLPINTHASGHPAVAAGVSSSTNVSSTGASTAAGPQGVSTPYPPSFVEVMEMVSKGVTPPNVRSDINDKPPDPTRPPSEPRMPPRTKPWESAAAARTPGLPFPPYASSSSPNAHLPPPTPSVNPTPSASPARAANGVVSPQDISSPFPSMHTRAAANSKAVDDGDLLHSSREWLGASSPLQVIRDQDQAALSHSGSLPLQRLEDGSSSSGSKQQAGMWGGSKLRAAAEPYAPSWAASAQQQRQQQQQQPAIASPASASTPAESSVQAEQELPAHNPIFNPIFKGLEQEVRSGLPEGSGADRPHQNGQQGHSDEAIEAGSSSSSTNDSKKRPSAAAPSAQTSAEGAPPASRPLSVLQPNPSWKPPPPPMPTVSHIRQKKASISPSTNGPPAAAPGVESEGVQGTAAQVEESSSPSRLAEQEEQEELALADGSKGGGGVVEQAVEIPAESPVGKAAAEGRPQEVVHDTS